MQLSSFTSKYLSLWITNCCLVAQACLTLWDPMDWSMPGFPVLHHLPEFAQTHVHWVGDVIQPVLRCPLLLLSSIFLSIRVFSNELALHISFNISPSNDYSGLISFRKSGYPLQYSCLGNSMDRGALQALVRGVPMGWTWLTIFFLPLVNP